MVEVFKDNRSRKSIDSDVSQLREMTQPPLWETRGATIAQILDFPIGGRHILSIIWSPQELFSDRVDVQMIVKNFS